LASFNFFEQWKEPQKAHWVFYRLLKLIKHDPKQRVKLDESDKEKADKFIQLYEGNGKSDAPPMERGLYALDIISREFTEQDELGNVCRGYDATREKKLGRWIVKPVISPRVHHSYLMRYYKKIDALMYQLWHEIAEQVEQGTKVETEWGDQKPEPVEKDVEELSTTEPTDYWLQQGRLQQQPPEREAGEEI